MATLKDMTGFFGDKNSFPRKAVPASPNLFGMIILDAELRRRREHQIPFQYIEQVPNYQKSAQYEDITTIHRFEPVSVFSHNNAQEFTLTLIYYAEGLEAHNQFDGKKNVWTLEYIEKLSTKIKALNIARYTPRPAPPYKVLLNIGNLYSDFPVIVRDISMTYEPPFYFKTMQSFQQKITLQCRSSYPLYQAIDGSELVLQETATGIMAQKKFNRLATGV